MAKILIELNTEEITDQIALFALVRSLAGDAPPAPAFTSQPAAASVTTTPPPPPSEALLASEAERAAAGNGAAPPEDAGLDINGLPWDERIHAGTKAKNADGSWRGRRGIDDATVATVTAELKAKVAAAAPPPAEEAPASPETAFTPPAASVAPPPPAAPAPPAPPAADGGEPMTYPKIIRLVGDKGLAYDELNRIAGIFGLPGFKDLVGRPDLFDSFVAALPA